MIAPPRLMAAVLMTGLLFPAAASARQKDPGMRVSTRSAEARASFARGIAKMETLHWEPALEEWRNAAQVDPQFALAHIFVAMLSHDPAEQVAEREKAVAARKFAGGEEQLIIDWIASAGRSQWIPAIQAMNAALSRYPQDKDLAFLAGLWLEDHRQSARAIVLFERASRLDPNFAAPLNGAAHAYAWMGDFDKAFATMKLYTALLPGEANAEASFAEISRMAGRFEDAVTHYQAALTLDPAFADAQAGLADTYALMGEQAKARAEYAAASQKATTRVQTVTLALQSAVTYVRENDFHAADAAFQEAARQAHHKDLGVLEAEAYRMMAVYQKDVGRAMKLLRQAEAVTHEKHQMPQSAQEEELAIILRNRVGRQIHDGKLADAVVAMNQLAGLAKINPSWPVQSAYNGVTGAILMAQGKYDEAIPHLEDDDNSPFSVQRLILAYEKTGARENAARLSHKLAAFYEPTIEQALIVPEFRKTMTPTPDQNSADPAPKPAGKTNDTH